MMRRRDEKSGGGCPIEEVPGARRNERHSIIAAASQDFLDQPGQVPAVTRDLFRSLVMDTIPTPYGKGPEDKDVDRWFANSPVERRLLIARGQQQAIRSALAHVVFIKLAGGILPLLEGAESLVPSAK
jgi:hypothetical protein